MDLFGNDLPKLPEFDEEFVGEGDRFRLSPTAISTYLQDPAMYYYTRVLRMPQPPQENMAVGSAVHAGIEYALKAKLREGTVPPLTEMLDYARGIWQQKISGFPPQPGNPLELVWLRIQNDLLPAAYEDLLTIEPGAVESHEIAGVPGQEFDLHGYIDLVHADGTVTDYKTAAKSPSKDKKTGEYVISNMHRLQLVYYAWLTSKGEREVPVEIRTIVKTKYPKIVVARSVVTPEEMEGRLGTATTVYQSIKNKVFFPNYGAWWCSQKNCQFWDQCHKEF